jgi:transposase InsO family protein
MTTPPPQTEPDSHSILKLNPVYRFHRQRYRTSEDIARLWPEEEVEGLEEERGVWYWVDETAGGRRYEIVSEDRVGDVLKREYRALPPSIGVRRFHSILARKYIGIRVTDCSAFLRHDEDHQKHSTRRNVSQVRATVASAPFKIFACDVMFITTEEGERKTATRNTPTDGRRGVLTVVDLFSKYAYCSPTLTAKGAKGASLKNRPLIQYLDEIFRKDGAPGAMRCDNEFRTKEMRTFFDRWKIKPIFSTPGAPQGNGQVERFNSTLRKGMESRRGKPETLDVSIQRTVKAYNNSKHSVTARAPVDVHTRELDENIRRLVYERLLAAAGGRASSKANLQALQPDLVVGDRVRILNTELDAQLRQRSKKGQLKGAVQPYSDQVFTVKHQDSQGFVTLKERPDKKHRRHTLLKIPEGDPDFTVKQDKSASVSPAQPPSPA